jgi:hypothetical protein
MEKEDHQLTGPYAPFKTFFNTLDHLNAIGIPHVIDRAVFPSLSGIMQSQVLGAYKFLGLIDEHGKPTPDLVALTIGKDRKAVFKELLKKRYEALVSLDLTKVSPTQLDKALTEYNVSGATHRKAKSFFLKAAQFAELPLSPLLTRKTRSSGGGGVGRRRRTEPNGGKTDSPVLNTSGTTKTITLKSGGQLTLSLTVNLFDLLGKDRDFVFGIIDKIQNYQAGLKMD